MTSPGSDLSHQALIGRCADCDRQHPAIPPAARSRSLDEPSRPLPTGTTGSGRQHPPEHGFAAMRALMVRPGTTGSLNLGEVGEQPREEGAVLVQAIAVGLCGTDADIVNGDYGQAPRGEEFLV